MWFRHLARTEGDKAGTFNALCQLRGPHDETSVAVQWETEIVGVGGLGLASDSRAHDKDGDLTTITRLV